MTVTNPTPKLKLGRPNFNVFGWHSEVNSNWVKLEAAITAAFPVVSIDGPWTNGTLFEINDRVYDEDDATAWVCNVEHTSALTGSMEDDRTANPTYWNPILPGLVFRGEWVTATEYNFNDVVTITARGLLAYAIDDHIAGATFDGDRTDHWNVLIDFTDVADAAADIEDWKDEAEAAAVTAIAQAIIATTQAGIATTQAGVAGTNAATATTQAGLATTAKNSAVSAQVAAEAALASTLSAFDSFDDRYLGPKAADPALDNDGNALIAGALYFNTVSGAMMVYTGAVWTSAYIDGSTTLVKANNLSDVPNKATGRTNLGVAIGSDVQAWDQDLTDIAGIVGVNDNILQRKGGSWVQRTIAQLVTDLRTILDSVYQAAGSGSTIPVGSVTDYAGATAPSLWVECYGQAISRTTYSALFTAIGTIYGAGNGTTTFNVPDARGRVSAGEDDMGGSSANRLTGLSGGIDGDTLGNTGGAESHTLTTAQLASHPHTMPLGNMVVAGNSITTGGSGAPNIGAGVTSSAGSDNAHNNVQPTIIFKKIIYAGV